MIFFGEAAFRRAMDEYIAHYLLERSHQGIGNEIIDPVRSARPQLGPVVARERLGGLLRYYHRAA